MPSVDSYRLRPSEELAQHLAEVETQRENAWDLYQSLCALEDMLRGVVAEKIGHEALVETVEPGPPLLSSVAA